MSETHIGGSVLASFDGARITLRKASSTYGIAISLDDFDLLCAYVEGVRRAIAAVKNHEESAEPKTEEGAA